MECNGLLNQLSFRKRAYSIKQLERFFDLFCCCCCVCFSAKYLCCCRLFFHFMSQSFFANLLFVQLYLKKKTEVSRIKHFFVYSHTLSRFNNSFTTSVLCVQKLKETKKRPNTISNSIPLFYLHSHTKLNTITINDHTDKSNSEYQSELNANENLYSKRTQIESINCFAVYFQTEHNKETNEKYAQTRGKNNRWHKKNRRINNIANLNTFSICIPEYTQLI